MAAVSGGLRNDARDSTAHKRPIRTWTLT